MIASAANPPYASKAMAGVRSALFFAREMPLHFHFFVDAEGEKDMHRALAEVEPWLLSRCTYEMHGESVLKSFFKMLRSTLPVDCLGKTSHFGDAGFIRLFVHRAGNEHCALVGKHMIVFVVLFCFRSLDVFGIVFGCVWCLVVGLCCVVFGVWFRCCVLFGVRCSGFGLLSSRLDDHV